MVHFCVKYIVEGMNWSGKGIGKNLKLGKKKIRVCKETELRCCVWDKGKVRKICQTGENLNRISCEIKEGN